MIKIFFKLVLLAGFFATMFFAFNAVKTIDGAAAAGQPQSLRGSDNPSAVVTYGRKAMATTMEFAAPILKKFGIDAGDNRTQDSDPITQHMEDAGKAVDEAFKKIGN